WRTWKVYKQNKFGVIGIVILGVLLFLAFFGSYLTPYDPYEWDLSSRSQSPSSTHPLGTNNKGQDMLAVMFAGLKISLQMGILAGSLTVIIGTILGVSSAYLGGWPDRIIMRISEIVLIIPALPLMLLLSSIQFAVYGKPMDWKIIAFVYVAVFWPVSTRLIRGQVLTLRELTFITSAKASGATDYYIIRKHLLPNVFPLMLAMIIASMRQAILYEAFLSFLGLGDRITWSLGSMLRQAQDQFAFALNYYWLIYPPAIAIALTTLSFAFIAMALDEIVNPRLRKR
ncbi:hypothetical protein LCGC14_2597000, partial [marine sediment metagenome]